MLLALVAAAAATQLNVLMICIDDLRTELSTYPEGSHIHSPNFERLADISVVFDRAYVQVAVCMPSRTALLTSRRPDTSRSWTIEQDQYWRKSGGNFTTLPQTFKDAGFFSCGMGKVFHESAAMSNNQDYQYSWSSECLYPKYDGTDKPGIFDPKGISPPSVAGGGSPAAYRFPDDNATYSKIQDGILTDHTVETIAKLNNGTWNVGPGPTQRPFFLAVGFHKPHLPWWVPSRFFELYPDDSIDIAPHPLPPIDVPPIAMQNFIVGECHAPDLNCGDLGKDFPFDNVSVAVGTAKYMRQAYWAAVSFTDYNIGRVLDALEGGPHFDSTIIALWGDHGYQLGDNDLWAKMTCFEHATRIPLFVRIPGVQARREATLVEQLDIMPTLIEEAIGTPAMVCPLDATASRMIDKCVEGRSLSALLHGSSSSSSRVV
jgi:arylsulfatase A-like enzyme